MFKRPRHQTIETLLGAFDGDFLAQANCYFGGGTAIVLCLDEYRESLDIDFLCASKEGYRLLRNTISQDNLGPLLKTPVKHLRNVRADRYGIRTILEIDKTPIKMEIVSEGRIEIAGSTEKFLGVPVLSRDDMYAEKLLANADRGLDSSVMSRDIIDLAMMIDRWGIIPQSAWKKAIDAYGDHVLKAFETSCQLVSDQSYLISCLQKMRMEPGLSKTIQAALLNQKGRSKGTSRPQK